MKGAAQALDEFGIEWEMRVISAHRTPDDAVAYARGARGRGVDVIIAGAGGAAHLPGVIAALTPLPVIGVPIATGGLGGLDALLSIVQMPKGIPVATVAVDNARNAGLLAVRMLALKDPALSEAVVAFQAKLADEVRHKDAALVERNRQG
jgi:5-(carboxyamino)imidazole ribonucleotide mutase